MFTSFLLENRKRFRFSKSNRSFSLEFHGSLQNKVSRKETDRSAIKVSRARGGEEEDGDLPCPFVHISAVPRLAISLPRFKFRELLVLPRLSFRPPVYPRAGGSAVPLFFSLNSFGHLAIRLCSRHFYKAEFEVTARNCEVDGSAIRFVDGL